jgi:hypothetical protein
VSAEEERRAITEITHIENHTDIRIGVLNRENNRDYKLEAKNPDTGVPGRVMVNWWVPWCTNEDEWWWGHSIQVYEVTTGPWYQFQIWQRDVDWNDKIRWTNKLGWDGGAHPMPGDSHVTGRRVLKIYKINGPATQDNNERAELIE